MYSKIDSRFWTDEKVLGLSIDARYLMLYLLTTSHRNVIGCYRLPKAYAIEDTGLAPERYDSAWRELLGTEVVEYDEHARMVLVTNFLKYNPIENPNQVTGALARLEGLPKCPLLSKVVAALEGCGKEYLTPLIDLLSALMPENAGITAPETACETVAETLAQTVSVTLAGRVTETSNSNSSSISSSKRDIPPTPLGGQRRPVPFADIQNMYNSICASYPAIRLIDGQRKRAVAARWATYKSLDTFRQLFEMAEGSDFLKGKNNRNWQADFDWLVKPTNMAKVLEGKFCNERDGPDGPLCSNPFLALAKEEGWT